MGGEAVVNHGKAESAAKEALKLMAKSSADPYTQKNKTSFCAFYARGNCKRDKDCPFLHQMPHKTSSRNGALVKARTERAAAVKAADEAEAEKNVDLKDALAIPVPAPVGKEKAASGSKSLYPSQNPALLGTSTRTFTAN